MDNNSTLSAGKTMGQGISPKQKKEAFAAQLLRGAVIGVAGMLPGVSGGVLAVAMGVYRPVLEALNGLFKSFRRGFFISDAIRSGRNGRSVFDGLGRGMAVGSVPHWSHVRAYGHGTGRIAFSDTGGQSAGL